LNLKKGKMPTLKAIHICNSLQPAHKPEIAKEYGLPTLTFELNKKHRKTKQSEKTLHTTKN